MSVAVVITLSNEFKTPPTYLPVATEAIYSTYWLPAATKLGFMWLPLFQTGMTIAAEDFPSVRGEFALISDYFAKAPDDDPMIEHLRERSRWVSEELERLDPAKIRDLFIG